MCTTDKSVFSQSDSPSPKSLSPVAEGLRGLAGVVGRRELCKLAAAGGRGRSVSAGLRCIPDGGQSLRRHQKPQ